MTHEERESIEAEIKRLQSKQPQVAWEALLLATLEYQLSKEQTTDDRLSTSEQHEETA